MDEGSEASTPASRPQSCDPTHPASATTTYIPMPSTPASQPAGTSPPQAPPTSLDTQETSVRREFDAWMHQKHTKDEYALSPTLDECSESARFRHAGWKTIRRRVWGSLERTGQSPARRRAFGECGSYSWIEQSTENAGDFRVRYNHCHDRLCTPCANARSVELTNCLLALMPKDGVKFITLTLQGHNQKLTDLIDRLYTHFRALRIHPFWAERITGGAAFLEIKWSDKAQQWHPHLHVIAIGTYIDQGFLSRVWHTITRDSFICDVRAVRDPETTGRYVTKYASKPLNTSFSNTPALLDEALSALKGRRLCLCFGDWYGTALSNAEDATLDGDGDDKSRWHFFMDLETLLSNARSGLRDAVAVIRAAGVEDRWRMALTDSS